MRNPAQSFVVYFYHRSINYKIMQDKDVPHKSVNDYPYIVR